MENRKKLERVHQRLSEGEAQLSSLDAIIVIDENSIVKSVTPSAARLFGYLDDELLGETVDKLMLPIDAKSHHEKVRKYMATGESTIIGGGQRTVVGVRRDGSEIPVAVSVGEAMIDGRRYFIGIWRIS